MQCCPNGRKSDPTKTVSHALTMLIFLIRVLFDAWILQIPVLFMNYSKIAEDETLLICKC